MLPVLVLAVWPLPSGAELPLSAPPLVPESPVWSVPVVHTASLFFVMRKTEAVLWPTPFAERRPEVWLRHYERAFTKPPLFDPDERAFEWDHDDWKINVLGHGLLGSELYYRPRRCGAPAWAALLYSAAASTTWEYVYEGNGVRPSALDLVFTPASGLILGEGRFWGWKLAGGIQSRGLRTAVRIVLDPLGEFSRALGTPC